jgi:PIN domain nuclease of toxin-antitoxin system
LRLLLDTHAFLWWLDDNPKLGKEAREAIASPSSTVYVSSASIWEISIKVKIGKLEIASPDLVQEIDASNFIPLPIEPHHAWLAGSLPRHHDDPFDRMLVAQAQSEELVLVTRDQVLQDYGVSILPT